MMHVNSKRYTVHCINNYIQERDTNIPVVLMLSLRLIIKHTEREGVSIKHHGKSQLSIAIILLNRRIFQI